MNHARCFISFLILLIMTSSSTRGACCVPASSFTRRGGAWYDNFGINRNYYGGPDGFLPKLIYESLGEYKELAYSIGERFRERYPSKNERAVAILRYVQRWTEYGYDGDHVVRNGVPQEEWAWNADEMAHAFDEVRGIKAIGDCEDMAFLCGAIYIGAGFEVAIVDALEHAALLIWLPEYPNANLYWDIPGDGREAGWIWVEATGKSNPLGWTPPDFRDGGWTAHIIGSSGSLPGQVPHKPISIDLDILAAIIFIILLSLLGSKRRR